MPPEKVQSGKKAPKPLRKKAPTAATKRKPKAKVKSAGKRGSANKKKARAGKAKSETGFVHLGEKHFFPAHCTMPAQWQGEI